MSWKGQLSLNVPLHSFVTLLCGVLKVDRAWPQLSFTPRNGLSGYKQHLVFLTKSSSSISNWDQNWKAQSQHPILEERIFLSNWKYNLTLQQYVSYLWYISKSIINCTEFCDENEWGKSSTLLPSANDALGAIWSSVWQCGQSIKNRSIRLPVLN